MSPVEKLSVPLSVKVWPPANLHGGRRPDGDRGTQLDDQRTADRRLETDSKSQAIPKPIRAASRHRWSDSRPSRRSRIQHDHSRPGQALDNGRIRWAGDAFPTQLPGVSQLPPVGAAAVLHMIVESTSRGSKISSERRFLRLALPIAHATWLR